MEVRVVDAKTTAALEQDGSLRCLLKIKYKHRDRHSVPAIAWARRKAEAVSRGLLKGAGLEAEADAFTITLNLVSLGKYHHASYICFDLFLDRCSSEISGTIDRSTRQPIHVISKRGDVLIARRDPGLDQMVAEHYERIQESDKGPRPYFSDSENPPFYDRGHLVEAPWGEDAEKYFEDYFQDNGEDDADDGKDNAEDEEELRRDQASEDG